MICGADGECDEREDSVCGRQRRNATVVKTGGLSVETKLTG